MSFKHSVLNAGPGLALAFFVNCAAVSTAFAYVDPGTGTMLLQMAGAMIAAGLFYLRSIRSWAARRLGFGKSDAVENQDRDNDNASSENVQ
jgi:hypothetical protein